MCSAEIATYSKVYTDHRYSIVEMCTQGDEEECPESGWFDVRVEEGEGEREEEGEEEGTPELTGLV